MPKTSISSTGRSVNSTTSLAGHPVEGTIENDESATITIGDVSQSESDSGQTVFAHFRHRLIPEAADGLLFDAHDDGFIDSLETQLRTVAPELYAAINDGSDAS